MGQVFKMPRRSKPSKIKKRPFSLLKIFIVVIVIWFLCGIIIFKIAFDKSRSAVQGHYIEDGRIKLQMNPEKLKVTDPLEREKIREEVKLYLDKLKDPSLDINAEEEQYV